MDNLTNDDNPHRAQLSHAMLSADSITPLTYHHQTIRRHHQRQSSTPSAVEAAKTTRHAPTPSAGVHAHASSPASHHGHRRGLSLAGAPPPPTVVSAPGTPRRVAARQRMLDWREMVTTRDQGAVQSQEGQELASAPAQAPINIRISTGTSIPMQHVQHVQQRQQSPSTPRHHRQHHQNQILYPADLKASHCDADSYLTSPHNHHHAQSFNTSVFDSSAQANQFASMLHKNQAVFGTNNVVPGTEAFPDFFTESPLSGTSYLGLHESPVGTPGWTSEDDNDASSRRSSRRISSGILDRVVKFEDLADLPQRPITPTNQNDTAYFPLTPVDTPHQALVKQDPSTIRPNRFSNGYDESMEETIKPVRRANQRAKGIFDELRRQAEEQQEASQSAASQDLPLVRADTMPDEGVLQAVQLQTPDFASMVTINNGFLNMDGLDIPGPDLLDLSNMAVPFESSPELSSHINAHQELFLTNKGELQMGESASEPPTPASNMNSVDQLLEEGSPGCQNPHQRHHRRTESLASIASAASISSINVDESRVDTGIDMHEIEVYIQGGPDEPDGKWYCGWEDCDKRFGRKENIKSHVQTHLNDRQYQCPTCQKCFVRQHDLKRHAKIHTGVKPYLCDCGNSFARHDALTRHRQRGMCVGAFDGVVRKVVKRGRPRKDRGEGGAAAAESREERKENKARHRRNNQSVSSVSSFSGYSDSSVADSPSSFDVNTEPYQPDAMDMDMEIEGINSMNTNSFMPSGSSAPMPTMPSVTPQHRQTRGVGPGRSTSPKHQQPSFVFPATVADSTQACPVASRALSTPSSEDALQSRQRPGPRAPPINPVLSPARSHASQYNTPPDLVQSSSPPSSGRRLLEVDSLPQIAPGGGGGSGVGIGLVGSDDSEDVMLMQAYSGASAVPGLVQLHSGVESTMFIHNGGPKLDEDFDAFGMFTNDDEVFFGAP